MRRTRLSLASVRNVLPGTPLRRPDTQVSTPGDGQRRAAQREADRAAQQRDLYQHTPTQRPTRRTRGSS